LQTTGRRIEAEQPRLEAADHAAPVILEHECTGFGRVVAAPGPGARLERMNAMALDVHEPQLLPACGPHGPFAQYRRQWPHAFDLPVHQTSPGETAPPSGG